MLKKKSSCALTLEDALCHYVIRKYNRVTDGTWQCLTRDSHQENTNILIRILNIAIRIKYKIKNVSQETCEFPIQNHRFKWEGRIHLLSSKLERMLFCPAAFGFNFKFRDSVSKVELSSYFHSLKFLT